MNRTDGSLTQPEPTSNETPMRHSPEPWQYKEGRTTSNPYVVAYPPNLTGDQARMPFLVFTLTANVPADAARIVACVNACAGIPTEGLEAGVLACLRDDVTEFYDFLMNFRDDLATDKYADPNDNHFYDWCDTLISHITAAGGEVPTYE